MDYMMICTQLISVLWTTLPNFFPYVSYSNRNSKLDLDLLLKGMMIFFENEIETNCPIQKKYKKELYPIYTIIVSDYKEYQRWEKYNALWINVWKKDTTQLVQKIQSQLQLFLEGMHLYSLMKSV
jgi:hypothetical protein